MTFGIVALNLIALALFLAVEPDIRHRWRRQPERAPQPPDELDRWIGEIEQLEHRQAVASPGDLLPQSGGTAES